MLSNLKNVFKVTDLRNKILFVMAMIALYRLGVAIRVPGIDADAVKQFKKGVESQGALGFLDLFSGGAFGSFSIFALGIMPYITSSIIMQVLGVVIPKLEKLQQEGAVGQRKITQYTRYLAIGISLMQATALTFIFGNGNGNAFFGAAQRLPSNVKLLPDGMWPRGYLVILTLVAGTAVLMWIGELISQRGIGNGMSMIIFASVVSRLPFGYYAILQEKKWFAFALLVVVSLLIVVAVVRVELAQRRIPVQFAKRVVGRRMYGGQNTYIPLKVNQSGVVPIIFASSVLLLPVLLINFLGGQQRPRLESRHPEVGRRQPGQQPQPRLHRALLAADRGVRLLLQLDRLRPDPPGRPDPPSGRVHPRRPTRSADRAVPGQGRQPHHPPRRALRRGHRHHAVHHLVVVRRAELPVRRHHRADCRRRRTRTHASDRQPIDAAQLRGLPEVTLPRLSKGGSSAA